MRLRAASELGRSLERWLDYLLKQGHSMVTMRPAKRSMASFYCVFDTVIVKRCLLQLLDAGELPLLERHPLLGQGDPLCGTLELYFLLRERRVRHRQLGLRLADRCSH